MICRRPPIPHSSSSRIASSPQVLCHLLRGHPLQEVICRCEENRHGRHFLSDRGHRDRGRRDRGSRGRRDRHHSSRHRSNRHRSNRHRSCLYDFSTHSSLRFVHCRKHSSLQMSVAELQV